MKNYTVLVLFMIFSLGFSQNKFSQIDAEKFQKQINSEYADAKTSPLMEEDLKTFKTLDFYPINSSYFVDAKFEKAKNEKVFEMKTTGTRTPKYIKYGTIYFTLEGVEMKLNVYRNIELSKQKEYKDHLFLPFSDLTCGKESYIGGRYIDLKIPKGKTIAIDFNQAYNPYCAYNHKYSCPLVPLENDLKVEIKAWSENFSLMEFFNFHTHQFTNQSNVLELVNQYPQEFDELIPFYSIGIHPWYIKEDQIDLELEIIEKKLQNKNCLAIGECGLDKRIEIPFEKQVIVFEKQLVLAEKYKKPVVIHCVAAFQEVIAIKKKMKISVPMIIHGFSKNNQAAQQLIKEGFYIFIWKISSKKILI